jgi:hypothetical protein
MTDELLTIWKQSDVAYFKAVFDFAWKDRNIRNRTTEREQHLKQFSTLQKV